LGALIKADQGRFLSEVFV